MVTLGEKLKNEVHSNETCITKEIEQVNEDWRVLNGELKDTIEYLQLLLIEIKSKDLDQKFFEIDSEINEVEDDFENNSREGRLKSVDDIDAELTIFKVLVTFFYFGIFKRIYGSIALKIYQGAFLNITSQFVDI